MSVDTKELQGFDSVKTISFAKEGSPTEKNHLYIYTYIYIYIMVEYFYCRGVGIVISVRLI